jgi:hypothetical protein
MSRHHSTLQKAMGQLILAIQKEENLVVGDGKLWRSAQAAREKADSLFLVASDQETLRLALAGRSITEFIGAQWLASHSAVRPALSAVLKELRGNV